MCAIFKFEMILKMETSLEVYIFSLEFSEKTKLRVFAKVFLSGAFNRRVRFDETMYISCNTDT